VRDGCVLLCHRHPNRQWYPNVWDVPGGHIEADESPTACSSLAKEWFLQRYKPMATSSSTQRWAAR